MIPLLFKKNMPLHDAARHADGQTNPQAEDH
jgi:hypothetical protein